MRPTISRLVLFGLLAATVLFVPISAHAAPVGKTVAPAACPHPQPYPPAPNATVQSSTTHPNVGQHIEASGIHYCPDEDVRLTIGGTFVGTGHTDSVGTFDPQVVVPGPAGQKLLCGIGASGLAADRDCLTLFISAGGTGGGSGGGTSFTGVEVGALIALGALLLVGGGVLLRVGQRRKHPVAG